MSSAAFCACPAVLIPPLDMCGVRTAKRMVQPATPVPGPLKGCLLHQVLSPLKKRAGLTMESGAFIGVLLWTRRCSSWRPADPSRPGLRSGGPAGTLAHSSLGPLSAPALNGALCCRPTCTSCRWAQRVLPGLRGTLHAAGSEGRKPNICSAFLLGMEGGKWLMRSGEAGLAWPVLPQGGIPPHTPTALGPSARRLPHQPLLWSAPSR